MVQLACISNINCETSANGWAALLLSNNMRQLGSQVLPCLQQCLLYEREAGVNYFFSKLFDVSWC